MPSKTSPEPPTWRVWRGNGEPCCSTGTLSLTALQFHYGLRPPRGLAAMPQLQILEHTLSSHDELLGGTPQQGQHWKQLKQLKLTQFGSQWKAAELQAQTDGWSPAIYLFMLAEQMHQQPLQASGSIRSYPEGCSLVGSRHPWSLSSPLMS